MRAGRISVFWSYSDAELETALKEARSLSGFLRTIGHAVSANSYRTLNRRIAASSIDLSALDRYHAVRAASFRRRTPLVDVLVAGRPFNNGVLKRRLLAEGLLEDRCQKCGLGPTWQGQRISLQLDHMNGDRQDNRLENLRILCPNCHSQTPTFGSKKLVRVVHKCRTCRSARVTDPTRECRDCYEGRQRRERGCVPIEELITLARAYGFTRAGHRLGISGGAVKKRIIKHQAREAKRRETGS